MLRVMLVDDEVIALEGLRLLIDWHGERVVDVDPGTVAHEGPVYTRPIERPWWIDDLNAGRAAAGWKTTCRFLFQSWAKRRYCTASATCSEVTAGLPARSAMLRATRNSR